MSLTATLTLLLPLLRTAVSAGCSGVGVVMTPFCFARAAPRQERHRRCRAAPSRRRPLRPPASSRRADRADAADAERLDLVSLPG